MHTQQRSLFVNSFLTTILLFSASTLCDGFRILAPETKKHSTLTLVPKSFYFIRHGQTDWNIENRLQGQLDIPLNDTGREQAKALQETVRHLDITQVYFSPLSRAFETMLIACEHCAHIPQLPVVNLMERNFGEWQGEIWDQEAVKRYAHRSPVYGETESEYFERVVECVNELLGQCDGQVLIVAHGGVFWSLCQAAGIEYDVIPNGKVLHFVAPCDVHGQWRIEEI